jgi:hypothetical protein
MTESVVRSTAYERNSRDDLSGTPLSFQLMPTSRAALDEVGQCLVGVGR